MKADLIIHNASQLVTCASHAKPARGSEMLDLRIVEGGALAISDGQFVGVGTSDEIARSFVSDEVIDAERRVVCPGFVDPHTHIVYAGDRLDEFEMKIKGAAYLDILAAGGGILSTVRQTRDATVEELVETALRRLGRMIASGTTTCEIKTGYGLDTASELKMLTVVEELDRRHPMTVVPTFMPAHAVPTSFSGNANGYVDLICREMLQKAWQWFVGSSFHGRIPFFCDVFCEAEAFTVDQSRKVLETAKSLGFRIKAHVGQFSDLGGVQAAIDLGAASVDHLDVMSDEAIERLADSGTVGVVIPTESFNAGKTVFAPARRLIDSGCAIALSTDYNPGSAPCPSQQMAMAIAARYQKLTPAESMIAATVNAAHAIGLGDRVGSVETGKQADFLVLDARDYREAVYEFGGNRVGRVFRSGVEVLN